jgi:hypothetical protein
VIDRWQDEAEAEAGIDFVGLKFETRPISGICGYAKFLPR